MKLESDIRNLEDVKLFVDRFYERVREDELLAPVFSEKIQDRWSAHLEKMYSFWQTVLLDQKTYYGSPFLAHAQLPINHSHFNRWVLLFHETIDSLFKGVKAGEAQMRAEKMAQMFQVKMEMNKAIGFKNLL